MTSTGPPSGDGAQSAEIEFMRAVLLHNIGRMRDAAASYRRVLADPAATLDNRGSAANNLALVVAAYGRFDESLRHLQHAEELAADIGPSMYAFVAHNRGLVLAQSGRLAEGLAELDRSTELFTQTDVPLGEYYMEHADVLAELRLLPEARELAGRAAEELDAQGVLLLAAEARLTLAQTSLLAGDARQAGVVAAEAEQLFRRQRRTVWAARATMLSAEAALCEGSADAEVFRRAGRAAAVLDRSGTPSAAAAAHLTAGRLAEHLGRPDVGQSVLRPGPRAEPAGSGARAAARTPRRRPRGAAGRARRRRPAALPCRAGRSRARTAPRWARRSSGRWPQATAWSSAVWVWRPSCAPVPRCGC